MIKITLVLIVLSMTQLVQAVDLQVRVEVPANAPHLSQWAEKGKKLMIQWYPQIVKILGVKEKKQKVRLIIKKTEKGLAFASGNKIVVASHRIEKNPEKLGLLIHELTHVVQAYPKGNGWLAEAIADYVR